MKGSGGSSRRRRSRIRSSRLESLPSCLLVGGILHRLDIHTLFTVACVSSKLRSVVSQALTDLPSLQITEFFPDSETVEHILSSCTGIKTLTVDCLRLSDGGRCFIDRLGPNLEELKLLRSSSLDFSVVQEIGDRCPNLRLLVLEVRDCVAGFTDHLSEMLLKCTKLESFCMKIRVRTRRHDQRVCHSIEYVNFLPKTIKSLTLEPLNEVQLVALVCGIPVSFLSTLQKLSLVLEVITDKVLSAITKSIPHLLDLHLQDEPSSTYSFSAGGDLTNAGLESLRNCPHLKSLFLVRTNYSSFDEVQDEGIFHICDGCRELESVKLVGFSSVSDAGFESILLSCHNLKKFEVKRAARLTDMCFHNLPEGPSSLKQVTIKPLAYKRHNVITSKIVEKLSASNTSIELLNLRLCTNDTDKCIKYMSSFDKLTCLDLSKTSVTDAGIVALSKGSLPIKSLCLRDCIMVTDTGILMLVCGEGTISKTLSTLDLSSTRITDVAVKAIAREANAVTELCIRGCTSVTDSSIEALARKGLLEGSCNRPLRKLNIRGCDLISEASLKFFKRPFFRELWWIGVFGTCFIESETSVRPEVTEGRRLLTVCVKGCRMGCYKKWNYSWHKVPSCNTQALSD